MASNIIPFPPHPSNDNNNDGPPQPGLRSFIIYDEMPQDCIAFEIVDDKSAPHLRRGEFALVDIADRDPMEGELFLIQWMSGDRMIVETRQHLFSIYDIKAQQSTPAHRWNAEFRHSMLSLGSGEVTTTRWFDGPYTEDCLRQKIVGKVIGIYEPDFRDQMRRVA